MICEQATHPSVHSAEQDNEDCRPMSIEGQEIRLPRERSDVRTDILGILRLVVSA